MQMRKSLLAFVAAATATAALAAVTFDTTTGVGYIGRGDVITFVGKDALVTSPQTRYAQELLLDQDCYKLEEGTVLTPGPGKSVKKVKTIVRHERTVNSTMEQTFSLSSSTKQAKGNDNISGYRLLGFGANVGPALPTDICSSDMTDGGGWMPDGPISSTATGPGLLTYNGTNIPF